MQITTRFHGILADWVGTRRAGFELSPNATYGDLLHTIACRYRQNMPEQLWDQEKGTFKKQVRAVGKERSYDTRDDLLSDGEEITFLLMIAGG